MSGMSHVAREVARECDYRQTLSKRTKITLANAVYVAYIIRQTGKFPRSKVTHSVMFVRPT